MPRRMLIYKHLIHFNVRNICPNYKNEIFSFVNSSKVCFFACYKNSITYIYEYIILKTIVFTGFIQQGNVVSGQQRPPNHIIAARPQIPGAPIQWMQQQVNHSYIIQNDVSTKYN